MNPQLQAIEKYYRLLAISAEQHMKDGNYDAAKLNLDAMQHAYAHDQLEQLYQDIAIHKAPINAIFERKWNRFFSHAAWIFVALCVARLFLTIIGV